MGMGAFGDGATLPASLPARADLDLLAFEDVVGVAKEGFVLPRMVRKLASFPKLGGGAVVVI